MSSSLVCVSLRLLLMAMLAAVPVMASNPSSCPLQCICTTRLICSDLGEQSRVIDFTAVVSPEPAFSSLQFVGRTKIRTIQTRAFSGLSVQLLKLDRSGVGDVESGAFLGVFDLTDVDVRHNHISGSVDSGTFAVDTQLNSLNVSDNDIESVSSDAFELVGGLSLRDLRLAGNRLRTLPDRVFANLTGLEHLDLSGNQLANLTQPLFNDLLALQRLFLANNRISSLDPTLFNSLQSLDHLTLDNNELTSLPASVFSQLALLRILTLQGNRLSSVHSNVFPAQNPSLETLKLDRNRITDLIQVETSSLSSLMTLTLAGNRLKAIPVGYFDGFSNMTVLDLSRNNISSALDESSFEGLTSLSSLNLSSNNIPSISARTFGTTLRTLDLSKNDLDHYDVASGVFENAINLTNLYLRSNGFRRVNRGVFKNIPSLENLVLSDNGITSLNLGYFENLPNLRRLDLSKNEIYYSSSQFVNTAQLSHVDLDENRLSTMPVNVMNNLLNPWNFTLAHNRIAKLEVLQSTSIDMLNLTGNVISDIVDGAFNGTPQMRELYLGQNLLTRITASMFSGLNDLKYLDLSDNLISTIDTGSFQSMRYLTYLSIHGNKLASIEPGTFDGLDSITSLVLSANRLVSHVAEGVGQLSSMQELILDDNDIVSFNVSYYSNFENNFQRLTLRRNRISKLHGFGFSHFSFLDFGENQITDEIFHSLHVQNMVELRTLKLDGNDIGSVPTVGVLNQSLMELDLSNNALTDSSLATIGQLRRLQQLRLDGNSITNLSAADWGNLANSLSVLSLSNNRLTSLDQIGKLWSLKQLNVDNNLIESIPDSTFQPLYDLEVVSLRGDRLTTIGLSTLNGLEQKCTQLDLSSNYIGSIHPDSFHRLKNIRHLNLSNNVIEELVLPPIMDQLSELLLSNNRLTRFPDELYNLRSIAVLSLYNNVIENMPALDIGSEFGVRLVELSHNRLHTIDQVRFVGSVDVISIGGNELSDIGVDVLSDATFIRELNLSNNALGRLPVPVTLAVDRIARLDVSRCSLTSLDNWVVNSSTTQLIELSLSGNRLTVLPSTVVETVRRSLKHLDIRGNLLTGLNGDTPFGGLWQLSLAGNPWHCDCQLEWLRNLEVMIDNATCWTPSATAGELIICYDVYGCIVPEIYEEQLPQRAICEETIPPTGLRILKH